MTLLGTFIQTSLRVIFVYILVPKMGLKGVAFACAIGWTMMLAVEIPYYFHSLKADSGTAVRQRPDRAQ